LIKKLSLLVAAALAGSFLSVVPASASVPTIAVSINGTAVTTAANAATPATVTVPADNSVDAADAVKFALTGVETGTVVSVTAVNALVIPALATVAVPVTASAGAATWSVNTGTGTTAEFFVFTKTTAVGAVTIVNKGNAFTFYVKGTAGPAYNLAFAPAATANTTSTVKTVAKVTDAFGNAVAGVTPVAAAVNATVGAIAATAADGTTEVSVTYPTTAGRSAVALSITATDVTGFAAAVKTASVFVDVADLATLNAGLAADLAKAKADLEAEKSARAADKKAADDASAKAKADADKAAADAKAGADKALADAKALADKAAADAKAASDAALVAVKAEVAALTKALADLKKAYNKMAKKFKFPAVK
jgi:hypothetical protein